MDPRHPELSIERIDQLMNQFKSTLDKIRTSTVSSKISQLEREGGLVVQEICLVAPRLHEAMIQASRQRRKDLSRGVVEKPVEKPVDVVVSKKETPTATEEPSATSSEMEQVEPVKEEKPKQTAKKKTTKKAKK